MNRILLFNGDEWGNEVYYHKNLKKCMIRYTQKTLQEYIFEENREYRIIKWDDYLVYKNQYNKEKYCKPWIEVDKDYFFEKLECLPPFKWINDGFNERFLMSEYMTHNLTEHNVRIGNKYYISIRPDTMTLEQSIIEITNENQN